MEYPIDHWALVRRGSDKYLAIGRITKDTGKMVALDDRENCGVKAVHKDDVMAVVPHRDVARMLRDKIISAVGERDRRVNSASQWYINRKAEILAEVGL